MSAPSNPFIKNPRLFLLICFTALTGATKESKFTLEPIKQKIIYTSQSASLYNIDREFFPPTKKDKKKTESSIPQQTKQMGGGMSKAIQIKYQTSTTKSTDTTTTTKIVNDRKRPQSKVSWQLQERQKEMTCLYNTGNILSAFPTKVGGASTAIQAVLNLIPPALMFPNETTATLIIQNNTTIASKSFRQILSSSPFDSSAEMLAPVPFLLQKSKLSIPTNENDRSMLIATIKYGKINVGCLILKISNMKRMNQKGKGCKGMYLAEEVVLLNSIALKLSEYITKMVANDELLERQKELLCLHRITNNYIGDCMEDFLKRITLEIKHSMQFPEVCDAQIKLFSHGSSSSGGVREMLVVETPGFSKSKRKRWTLVNSLPISSCSRRGNYESGGSKQITSINYDENGQPTTSIPSVGCQVMGIVTVSYRSDGDGGGGGENPQNPVNDNVSGIDIDILTFSCF